MFQFKAETESAYCGARDSRSATCSIPNSRHSPGGCPATSRGYRSGSKVSLVRIQKHSAKGREPWECLAIIWQAWGAPIDGWQSAWRCRSPGLRTRTGCESRGFGCTKEVGSGLVESGLGSLGPTGANVIRSSHRGWKHGVKKNDASRVSRRCPLSVGSHRLVDAGRLQQFQQVPATPSASWLATARIAPMRAGVLCQGVRTIARLPQW